MNTWQTKEKASKVKVKEKDNKAASAVKRARDKVRVNKADSAATSKRNHRQELVNPAPTGVSIGRFHMKATDLLKRQHRSVKNLFKEMKKAAPRQRTRLLEQIASELENHMRIEEEIFYPAVSELGGKKADEMIPEAFEEHHVVKLVLAEAPRIDVDDERFEAKMTVLEELIEHHVEEEEKEMFKAAERLGNQRLQELGEQMQAALEQGEMEMPRRAAGGRR